jgi:hypothetical protein
MWKDSVMKMSEAAVMMAKVPEAAPGKLEHPHLQGHRVRCLWLIPERLPPRLGPLHVDIAHRLGEILKIPTHVDGVQKNQKV